jgi:hypothetical protein
MPAGKDGLAAAAARVALADDAAQRLLDQLAWLEGRADSATRRAALAVALAWGVPLILSLLAGNALGHEATGPFLLDWGAWGRFVVAIGVFILMERTVHARLRIYLRQFVETPLIAPSSMSGAGIAVSRAIARARAWLPMAACLLLAYGATALGIGGVLERVGESWLFTQEPDGSMALTAAGWWCAVVSGPLFWFLLLRWLWRHLVWSLLLRDLSRLELRLVVTHPDGLGGLGFIGQYPNAFALLVFAMSTALAAAIAQALQEEALSLQAHSYLMAGWLAVVVALFAAPLSRFQRPLHALKERTLLESAAQATRHFRASERDLLGRNLAAGADAESTPTSDIPDPTALYAAAKKMGTLPFSRSAVVPLAAAALLPLVAAGATQLPFIELWKVAKRLLLL